MATLDVGFRTAAQNEVTAALIRAGKLDEVPIFGRRMLADPRSVFRAAEKILADTGKIEQALVFMVLDPSGPADEETLAAVGAAYAKRGDPKMAARFYDKAQSILDQRRPGTVMDNAAMDLRFEQISLQALRGDMEGVKAALRELPAAAGSSPDPVETNRFQAGQKLIGFLLQFDHAEVALDVARSAPERFRVISLSTVARWDAEHGRLDDVSTIRSLPEDKANPKMRDAFLRWLAIATAKSGDVKSAVALASEASDPAWHRVILFEVAQTLPP